jgi:hypothetical protein
MDEDHRFNCAARIHHGAAGSGARIDEFDAALDWPHDVSYAGEQLTCRVAGNADFGTLTGVLNGVEACLTVSGCSCYRRPGGVAGWQARWTSARMLKPNSSAKVNTAGAG